MLTSYHTHSKFSDGSNTLAEMTQSAIYQNLDEIGFSDHLAVVSGSKKLDWAMSERELDSYISEVTDIKTKYSDSIKIKTALEVDYIPETIERIKKSLAKYDFDYLIGSLHFAQNFPIDADKIYWEKATHDERNDIIERYWKLVPEIPQSGLFDFVGHLDLYKKFGYLPSIDISHLVDDALDAIADFDMAYELNTSGWFKEIEEAYPSKDILEKCFIRGIPVVLTSDAHHISQITRSYDRGRRLLQSVGYTKTLVFTNRERAEVDL